jgi:hypothetical protein
MRSRVVRRDLSKNIIMGPVGGEPTSLSDEQGDPALQTEGHPSTAKRREKKELGQFEF